jgi:hypothetical protein
VGQTGGFYARIARSNHLTFWSYEISMDASFAGSNADFSQDSPRTRITFSHAFCILFQQWQSLFASPTDAEWFAANTMNLLFDAVDINRGGGVNAPELVTAEGVEQQQVKQDHGQEQALLSRLPPSSKLIPFLDGKLEDVPVVHHDAVPTGINWLDGKNIQEVIPVLIGCGRSQVPQSLLLDADTGMDKLVVTPNWWRGLTEDGQLAEIDRLKRVCRACSSGNAKLDDDFWQKMRNAVKSNPAAAAHIDGTGNVHAGTACTPELRKADMECTVSAKVAKPKKNPASTPLANGKTPRESRRGKKTKMDVHGLREGVMKDHSNPLLNLFQSFVAEAEKICNVHVAPHCQEPPTQKFSHS